MKHRALQLHRLLRVDDITLSPRAPPSRPTPCPDDEVVVALLQGALSPSERRRLDDHIDRCEACAQLVVDLVVISSTG